VTTPKSGDLVGGVEEEAGMLRYPRDFAASSSPGGKYIQSIIFE
jgi:hypothetical protein